MRFTGRNGWVASYKDTWHAGSCLYPIHTAWLKKFLEVMDGPKGAWFGIPSGAVSSLSIGLEGEDQESWNKAFEEWKNHLHDIYAKMTAKEPYIEKYDFAINLDDTVDPDGNGFRELKFTYENKKGYDEWSSDQDVWEKNYKWAHKQFNDLLSEGSLWW